MIHKFKFVAPRPSSTNLLHHDQQSVALRQISVELVFLHQI